MHICSHQSPSYPPLCIWALMWRDTGKTSSSSPWNYLGPLVTLSEYVYMREGTLRLFECTSCFLHSFQVQTRQLFVIWFIPVFWQELCNQCLNINFHVIDSIYSEKVWRTLIKAKGTGNCIVSGSHLIFWTDKYSGIPFLKPCKRPRKRSLHQGDDRSYILGVRSVNSSC